MQNLSCKTNQAGWLPSSSNRTAQAFSQPGKGILPSLGGPNRVGTNQMTSSNKSGNKNQGLDNNLYFTLNVNVHAKLLFYFCLKYGKTRPG